MKINDEKIEHQVEEISNLISDILEIVDNITKKYEGENSTFESNTTYSTYVVLKENLEFYLEYFIKFNNIIENQINDFVNYYDFIVYVSEYVSKINRMLKGINLVALNEPIVFENKITTLDVDILFEIIKYMNTLYLKTGIDSYDK